MKQRGDWVRQILQVLADFGPMTRGQVCRELGSTVHVAGRVLHRLAKPSRRHPKRVHISGWVRDDDVGRKYLRAVYALGDKPDAPKPRIDVNKEKWWSQRDRVARRRTASVFNLGLTSRQLGFGKDGKTDHEQT